MRPLGFHKNILKAGCVFLGAVLLLFAFPPALRAQAAQPARTGELIEAAFNARRAHVTKGDSLLSDPDFLQNSAGNGTGDWAAFAMARYGALDADGKILYSYKEDYGVYADALQAKLEAFYASAGVSSGTKLTEYFRMGLALTALGRDVSDIVYRATVYNPTALTRLSVMSLVYGLLALEMQTAPITDTPQHTDRDFAERIIGLQHADGGWSLTALSSAESDVDVTAMALTGLSGFVRRGDPAAGAAAEKALAFLSKRQSPNGDFGSYGTMNAESTAQVLTALCSLGIDPLTDARFIKSGRTVPDGLLRYRLADGSFTHSYSNDPENPAASAGNYNYLATDQAAYALVSLWRLQHGYSPLYSVSPDLPAGAARLFALIPQTLRRLMDRLRALMTLTCYET